MSNEIVGRPNIVWGDAVKQAADGKFGGYMKVTTLMHSKPYMPDVLNQLGLGAWTLEAWVKVDNDSYTGNQAAIFMADMRSDNSARFTLYLQKDQNGLPWGSVKGLVLSCMGAHSPATVEFPTDGTWHHVAVVFDGTEFRAYQDGKLVNRLAGNRPNWQKGDHLSFASQDANNDSRFNGGYDDIRVTRQVRYIGDFKVPTSAYPKRALTKLLDPHLPYRKINVTAEGDEGGNKIVDVFGHEVIKNGAPYFTLKNKKVGKSSMALDKANPSSIEFVGDDLILHDSDFCIELWFYCTEMTNEWYSIMDTRVADGSKRGFFAAVRGQDNRIRSWSNGGGNLDHQTPIVANRWYHLAVVRSNGQMRLFVDGVPSDRTTTVNDLQNNRIIFGHSCESVTQANFVGYMDDIRVTTGHAVHGAAFTPDDQPYVRAVPFPGTDPHEDKIVSLKRGSEHFPDADEAGLQWELHSNNQSWVNVGSRKFDRLSTLEFRRSDNSYMLAPDGAFAFGQEDFTLEFWMYPYDTDQYAMIFNSSSGPDTPQHGIWLLFQDGKLRLNTGNINNVDGPIGIHVWTHVCVERVNNRLYLFTNGRSVNDTGFDFNVDLNHPKAGIAEGGTRYNGLLANFRAYKGVAIHNGQNFVPPWAPETLATRLPYPGYGMSGKPAVTGLYDFENGKGDILQAGAITTAEHNWGKKAMTCTATGTSAYIPGALAKVGSGAFTMEFFVKLSAAPASVACFLAINNGRRDDGTLTIFLQDGHLRVSTPGDSAATATVAFPVGSWVHVAFTFDGTTYRGYQNGQLVTQTDNHAQVLGSTQNIGISNNAGYSPAANGFNGWIDDIRITRGLALYTADTITVPTKYDETPTVDATAPVLTTLLHFEE